MYTCSWYRKFNTWPEEGHLGSSNTGAYSKMRFLDILKHNWSHSWAWIFLLAFIYYAVNGSTLVLTVGQPVFQWEEIAWLALQCWILRCLFLQVFLSNLGDCQNCWEPLLLILLEISVLRRDLLWKAVVEELWTGCLLWLVVWFVLPRPRVTDSWSSCFVRFLRFFLWLLKAVYKVFQFFLTYHAVMAERKAVKAFPFESHFGSIGTGFAPSSGVSGGAAARCHTIHFSRTNLWTSEWAFHNFLVDLPALSKTSWAWPLRLPVLTRMPSSDLFRFLSFEMS